MIQPVDTDKFTKLEERLGRLLSGFESLKAENKELREAVVAREREIEELKERLKKLDVEKAAVKNRVDVLLERIDGLVGH
ncbi:MAG: cell division protein ZapB [Deltaproteobacteria bacterium]|nr:cell division protein ZapB [Deltaproteobacteria bacterium]